MYVNMNSNNPATGQVRYNGNNMEVYDGNTWTSLLMGYASVGLNPAAVEVISWVQGKMHQERHWETLAKDNVTIADALEQYKKVVKVAEEQMKVVVALTE
jgi:hypothetical protein